jgi:glutamine phosphoribosylpyrophosphate amidotransferase
MGLAAVRYRDSEADCSNDLFWALHHVTHTGPEGCGFAFYGNDGIAHKAFDGDVRAFRTALEMGTVPKESVSGYCGIGNSNTKRDHQPRLFDHKKHGKYALSFDGFLANEPSLREICNETYSTPHQVEVISKLLGMGEDINIRKK